MSVEHNLMIPNLILSVGMHNHTPHCILATALMIPNLILSVFPSYSAPICTIATQWPRMRVGCPLMLPLIPWPKPHPHPDPKPDPNPDPNPKHDPKPNHD